MRLLGLDVGEKTIGIAVSDPLGWFAQGVETYRRKDEESDLAYLRGLVKQYEAAVVVIGLPLNMNGSEGPSALRARRLGELLNERVSIQTEYQDERLSTVAAEKVLISGNVSRKGRKQVIDKMAAVIILQNYLDRMASKGNNFCND